MVIQFKEEIIEKIGKVADRLGLEAYVVGGYVRDVLLRRSSKDIDFVVVGSGIALAEAAAIEIKGTSSVSVFKNFGTAMLRFGELELEFVGARRESYRRESRKPIVEDGTLEDDQLRRDFTINALAASINKGSFGTLTDPFGGLADLEKKIIRTPQDPLITFDDDPLRMLRAVRFASQLGFTIDTVACQALSAMANRLTIVSGERITDEFNKILLSTRPEYGIDILEKTGLLKTFLPELCALKGVEEQNGQRHKDNFYHTLEVLRKLSSNTTNLWLRWAALLHDIGKPRTKKFDPATGWTFHGHDFVGAKMVATIFKRMRLPLGDPMKYVQKLVALHLRPIALTTEEVTDSAVRRLLFDAGNDTDDLMLLCQADITSKNEAKVARFLRNFELVKEKMQEIEEKDAIRNFQPPVTGDDIMSYFNLTPCHQVGIIKNAIKDAILDGLIPNNREAAFALMIEKGTELGLKRIE